MRENLRLIGVTGTIGSGKDTIADYLVSEHGFRKFSFGDEVKLIAMHGFDVPANVLWGPSEGRTGKVRRLLQVLGTEAGREFDPDHWVKRLMKRVIDCYNQMDIDAECRIVVPDVRFENEAEALYGFGGRVVRVERDIQREWVSEEQAGHASEAGVPDSLVHHTFSNNGSIGALVHSVDLFMKLS